MTERSAPGVRSESWELPTRSDASDRMWPDTPRVRSALRQALYQWVFDRMHQFHEGPDTPVCDPLARASACGLNWPDAPAVSGHFDHNVRSQFFSDKHFGLSPSFLASGAMEKRRFTSPKSAESCLASSAGAREEPKPLSTAQTPPPSQNVLTPPSLHHHDVTLALY
jgi:hypothetical protein